MIISLTGFMGCGKSSVAPVLAGKLSCFYFDLDDTIEMEEGRSIPEIFEKDGESSFRLLELEYLDRIISDFDGFPTTMVLSLGGGTVMTPLCAEMVKGKTFCVYLKASCDELVGNLQETGTEGRPMLGGEGKLRSKVENLMAQREGTYEKTAHLVLDTDGLTPEEIAERIIENLPQTLL